MPYEEAEERALEELGEMLERYSPKQQTELLMQIGAGRIQRHFKHHVPEGFTIHEDPKMCPSCKDFFELFKVPESAAAGEP